MATDYVVMRRGEATLESMRRALDQLGIEPGGDFVVTTPRFDEIRELGRWHRDDPDTSRDAARSNAVRAGTQRHKALAAVRDRGDAGATYDEARADTGIDSMQQRLTDLKQQGLLQPNGLKRRTRRGTMANAMVLTPAGRDALEAAEPSDNLLTLSGVRSPERLE